MINLELLTMLLSKQSKLLLKYCNLAIVIFGMVACTDNIEDLTETDTSGDAVWHSPEVLTRAQSQQYFLRDHAVGYSYNAMTGRSYSLDDVRCQVINRAELDRLEDLSLYYLYTIDSARTVRMEGNVYHSMTQYVHNCNFKASAEAQITVIAGGEAKLECSIFEDGTNDSYIIEGQSNILCGNYRIDASAIMELAKTQPTVLTPSFRYAVRQVANASNKNYIACVDSFINTYGTHVVTFAEMGGTLDVLLQLDAKKYNTKENLGASLSGDVLLGMFKEAKEGGNNSNDYKYLENSKCHIKVQGGDVSLLDQLTNMNQYKVGTLDADVFTNWQNSVRFNAENYENSTASVIRMDFVPIYEFVNDSIAKRRIRSTIEGSVQDMIDLLGNRNFVNVSFPYKPQNISYTLGNGVKASCASPQITNMIYGGRHVASICKERIESISANEDVWVVYPIYEGRIQLHNGLCQHNGRTYNVAWDGDKCFVTNRAEYGNNGMVYVTAGVPSFTAYTNIKYNKSHLLPYIETDTPFNVDGSYNKKATQYFVTKKKGNFYLPDSKGKKTITGIPNWAYDENTEMMKRMDEYVYIYNHNELKYND